MSQSRALARRTEGSSIEKKAVVSHQLSKHGHVHLALVKANP